MLRYYIATFQSLIVTQFAAEAFGAGIVDKNENGSSVDELRKAALADNVITLGEKRIINERWDSEIENVNEDAKNELSSFIQILNETVKGKEYMVQEGDTLSEIVESEYSDHIETKADTYRILNLVIETLSNPKFHIPNKYGIKGNSISVGETIILADYDSLMNPVIEESEAPIQQQAETIQPTQESTSQASSQSEQAGDDLGEAEQGLELEQTLSQADSGLQQSSDTATETVQVAETSPGGLNKSAILTGLGKRTFISIFKHPVTTIGSYDKPNGRTGKVSLKIAGRKYAYVELEGSTGVGKNDIDTQDSKINLKDLEKLSDEEKVQKIQNLVNEAIKRFNNPEYNPQGIRLKKPTRQEMSKEYGGTPVPVTSGEVEPVPTRTKESVVPASQVETILTSDAQEDEDSQVDTSEESKGPQSRNEIGRARPGGNEDGRINAARGPEDVTPEIPLDQQQRRPGNK